MSSTLQLVVPCFNEAGRLIPDLFLQHVAANRDTGFVFVDDGSTDRTGVVLADMAARSGGSISVLALPKNVGKARAVQLGVLSAFDRQPEFVGYWDADLATPLAAIPEFLEVLKARPDVEIVMGARVKLLGRDIRRQAARHYTGRVFATAASFALGVGVYDTQCGAKIFRATERIRTIFAAPFRTRWIFDVEILSRYLALLGTRQGEAQICEVPLKHWRAVPGSKLRPGHFVRAIWDLAMISLRRSHGRS
jgi:glycosyltransferase involved in cell wall biosynthesis